MKSAAGRAAALALGMILVFAGVVLIVLKIMPGPLRELDYLIVGAVATFAAMLLLFGILTTTWIKTPNVFYKRRRAGDDSGSPKS